MAASVLEECFGRADGVDEVRRLDVLDSSSRLYRVLLRRRLLQAGRGRAVAGRRGGTTPKTRRSSSATRSSLLDRINTTSTVQGDPGLQPATSSSAPTSCPPGWSRCCSPGVQLAAGLAVVTTDYDFQGLWLSSRRSTTSSWPARRRRRTWPAIGVPRRPGERLRASRCAPASAIRWTATRSCAVTTCDDDQPVVLVSAGAAGGAYTTASSSRRCGCAAPVPGRRRLWPQRRAEARGRATSSAGDRTGTGCSATPPTWPT